MKKKLKFKKGALHAQLGVDAKKPIPEAKIQEAASGKDGALAKRRVMFARNVLHMKK